MRASVRMLTFCVKVFYIQEMAPARGIRDMTLWALTLVVRKLIYKCDCLHESSSNISNPAGSGWGSGVGSVGLV